MPLPNRYLRLREEEEAEDPKEHLMHDPMPRGEMNSMVLDSMHSTTWKYWTLTGILAFIVVTCLFAAWYYLIMQGLGVAGVNRPVYWGIFLVEVVFWIGISHAGTFISAILRVLKVESRRPFTRAAELMTTFGLVQAGISVFLHMGRVWLSYWLLPFPNERGLWPDFHSPLMWDFMAINTYLLCSTMYLFLPLIPDLAMARDRSTGWRKTFYKILSIGFRGTRGQVEESKNCHEYLCLRDHPGDVLSSYNRVLGLCHGHPPRLVLFSLRAILRHRGFAIRHGSRGDRAFHDPLDDEKYEILSASRAF